MKAFASICFAMLATTTLSAEAFLPQTLRQLAEQSDLVVVGRVEAVEQGCSEQSTAIAELRVLETVKGVETESVKVTFHPGVICPSPATYKKEDIVIAFLQTCDAGTYTTGMASGAKVLPENQRIAYVKRYASTLHLPTLRARSRIVTAVKPR